MNSESDISKYAELLDDSHVNQLNFPDNSKTYQFNINDLQLKGVACANSNAKVERYVFRPLEFPLATKILHIPINRRQINKKKLQALIKEVKILRELSHCINVIDFYGYALYDKQVWIFMELMGASLEDLYKYFHEKLYPESRFSREIVIPEGVIGVIAYNILNALAFCVRQRIMHGDVKPRNVLINQKGEVKICDFGAAKILESGKDL
jgi:mitogen-activated protein kinase kinase 9